MTGALWRHCTHVWEHGYRRWCLNVAPSRNQAKRENTFYINLACELWTLFISIYSNIITKLNVLNAWISVQLHLCKKLMIFSLIQEDKKQLALIVGWFWSFSSATTCSKDVGCTLTNIVPEGSNPILKISITSFRFISLYFTQKLNSLPDFFRLSSLAHLIKMSA